MESFACANQENNNPDNIKTSTDQKGCLQECTGNLECKYLSIMYIVDKYYCYLCYDDLSYQNLQVQTGFKVYYPTTGIKELVSTTQSYYMLGRSVLPDTNALQIVNVDTAEECAESTANTENARGFAFRPDTPTSSKALCSIYGKINDFTTDLNDASDTLIHFFYHASVSITSTTNEPLTTTSHDTPNFEKLSGKTASDTCMDQSQNQQTNSIAECLTECESSETCRYASIHPSVTVGKFTCRICTNEVSANEFDDAMTGTVYVNKNEQVSLLDPRDGYLLPKRYKYGRNTGTQHNDAKSVDDCKNIADNDDKILAFEVDLDPTNFLCVTYKEIDKFGEDPTSVYRHYFLKAKDFTNYGSYHAPIKGFVIDTKKCNLNNEYENSPDECETSCRANVNCKYFSVRQDNVDDYKCVYCGQSLSINKLLFATDGANSALYVKKSKDISLLDEIDGYEYPLRATTIKGDAAETSYQNSVENCTKFAEKVEGVVAFVYNPKPNLFNNNCEVYDKLDIDYADSWYQHLFVRKAEQTTKKQTTSSTDIVTTKTQHKEITIEDDKKNTIEEARVGLENCNSQECNHNALKLTSGIVDVLFDTEKGIDTFQTTCSHLVAKKELCENTDKIVVRKADKLRSNDGIFMCDNNEVDVNDVARTSAQYFYMQQVGYTLVYCDGDKHLGTLELSEITDVKKKFRIHCKDKDNYDLESGNAFDTLCGNPVPPSFLGSVVIKRVEEKTTEDSEKVAKETAIVATVMSSTGVVVTFGAMMLLRIYV